MTTYGGQLRESACIAAQIGADDLEGHAVDHAAEESLPEVEFMVSERRHVVAEAVHQGDHGHSGRRGLVDIGVSGPAVAGIDEDDLLQRIAAGRDGCSQTREVLNPGVHVIGRQQHEGRFAGRAGHSSSGSPGYSYPFKPIFHNIDFTLQIGRSIAKSTNYSYLWKQTQPFFR